MSWTNVMDSCLFCCNDLNPGSAEHVFLSALGGRLLSYRATCSGCNNAFASNETGKVDDALADSFKEVRNGLKIWSGRDAPPPTLVRAGEITEGVEFDLAPGFVPVMRPGSLPKQLATGTKHQLVARDEADAKRLLGIIQQRGFSSQVSNAVRVTQKVGTVHRSASFDGLKVWRSVAKTAVVGFVVLYGNEQALRCISKEVRAAIRYGAPSINQFAGWDFVNEWPAFGALVRHAKSSGAELSGFEHSVVFADVESYSVAYVTLFGHWRFSVMLGSKTHLPVKGLALNPRSTKLARFVVPAQPASSYLPRQPKSLMSERTQVVAGGAAAFDCALKKWSEEAHADYVEALSNELHASIETVGDNEMDRAAAIRNFAEKLAALEHGAAWITELDEVLNEDD